MSRMFNWDESWDQRVTAQMTRVDKLLEVLFIGGWSNCCREKFHTVQHMGFHSMIHQQFKLNS